ncbi:hypothetical protein [Chitinophaga defluvii]|uniref:Lipoprotein n=1 Tax=Chitinophaga defluvii TaxID=3163343 RepID=A0ABV2TAM0_9BACT
MKQFRFISILALLCLISFYCKKSSSGGDTQPATQGSLQVISNASLANKTNALQAVYTSEDLKLKTHCYGTFDATGNPDKITEMVINDAANADTAINLIFDNQMRVTTLFRTKGGKKVNGMLTFDYDTIGKTIVNVLYYDFSTDSSKLLERYVVDNKPEFKVSDRTSYAAMGAGVGHLLSLLFIQSTASNVDAYTVKFVAAVAGLVGVNGAIFAVTTAAGCLLGATTLNPAGVAMGCKIGATVGAMMALSNTNAHAADVSAPPAGSPLSPSEQLEGSPLKKTAHYLGTRGTSGVIAFGGKPYCNYTVTYTYYALEVTLDKQTQTITAANLGATMTETIEKGCLPGDPVAAKQRHLYFLKNATVNGPTITINFTQDAAGFPRNNAVFVGGINGNNISGTLTFTRTPLSLPCVVSVSMNAKLIY